MKTVEERVKAGAALLDEEEPGWAWNVSRRSLDMSQCQNCILGQVFGGYSRGLIQLGIFDVDRGCIAGGFDIEEDDESYRDLQQAWIKEIKARTNVATPE